MGALIDQLSPDETFRVKIDKFVVNVHWLRSSVVDPGLDPSGLANYSHSTIHDHDNLRAF